MWIFPVFNKIFTANILYWECRRRKGALTPPPMHRAFPTGGLGGVAPPPSENCLSPPPRKTPPTKFLFPPPTKQQFSSYNPIKTAFLAVFIVPAPFLF